MIAGVFKEIGLADELGSGVRKLFRYCKLYSGRDPELIENDIFRFILPLSEENQASYDKTSVETPVEASEKTSEKTSEKIIELMRENANVSAVEIAQTIGLTSRAVEMQIAELKDSARIKRIGPDKGGHWETLP